jgi:hypothetical protein
MILYYIILYYNYRIAMSPYHSINNTIVIVCCVCVYCAIVAVFRYWCLSWLPVSADFYQLCFLTSLAVLTANCILLWSVMAITSSCVFSCLRVCIVVRSSDALPISVVCRESVSARPQALLSALSFNEPSQLRGHPIPEGEPLISPLDYSRRTVTRLVSFRS